MCVAEISGDKTIDVNIIKTVAAYDTVD